MNKFEDDLIYAQKATSVEFFHWLQNVSVELIKQREYSYGQEFLRLQQNVYELIFKQDGILNNTFRTTQQRFCSIEENLYYIKYLNILSPHELSLYNSLPSDSPLNPINVNVLPAHIQLFLKDPQIANMNQQFQTFQEVFKENLIQEKNQLKFIVNPRMMYWIYLLNGAINFKESALHSTDNSQKMLDCVFMKCKKKLNTNDGLLKQLTFNPYIVIIRRIIQYMVTSIKESNSIINTHSKQNTIFTLQQMIILLQEYSLFEHIYVQKLIDLNLSPEQQKLFNKIKPSSTVLDTQMMLIYLTIFFNRYCGIDLEFQYQQFKPFMKNSDIFNKQSLMIDQNRSFFFDCGRLQQFTYQQGLYKFFNHSFEVYNNEKQCYQINLLTHISTYVLFLRWQHAEYEKQIYEQVLIFDQALQQCIISQNQIFKTISQSTTIQYKGTNPLAKLILLELQPIYQYCKNKFGETPQSILFKDFNASNLVFRLDQSQQKFTQNDYSLDYHYRELDRLKNQMKNMIRFYYPFYTKLLITIFQCISNLNQLNESEYQGIIHLLTFFYSIDQNSYFCDILKLTENKPYQIPSYQEVKNFCEIYEKNSQEDNFLIKQNQHISKYMYSIVQLLMQYQQLKNIKNNKIILYLGQQFDIQTNKIKLIPVKSSITSKSTGRLSRTKISINQWKAPLKENELNFLFTIMWYFSILIDSMRRLNKSEYPQTEWPRKLASPINLIVVSLVIYILLVFLFMLM